MYVQKHIQVTGVDVDNINIMIGPVGYQLPITEIGALMGGEMDPLQTVKCDVARCLVQRGVSLTDQIAIKEAVEDTLFLLPE